MPKIDYLWFKKNNFGVHRNDKCDNVKSFFHDNDSPFCLAITLSNSASIKNVPS